MKRLSFVFLIVTLVAFSLPACGQILAIVSDSTCTSGSPCAGQSGQGCNSTTFTLYDSAQVTLCADIKCTGSIGGCAHCVSVAYIYPLSGTQVYCIHSDCMSDCGSGCESPTLAAGGYTLYSCLLPCPTYDCSECSTCKATAVVSVFP